MLISIHPENPDPRRVRQVCELLDRDGVMIVPTDTVYAFTCKLGSSKGLDALAKLKGVKAEKAQFSLICKDLSELSFYTKPLANEVFKMMRRALPGPYTFILEASGQVPKWFKGKKKTIGIRVPDHGATLAIVETLGCPLLVTSVHDDDEIVEYTTDPELIHERYGERCEGVIDGGVGHLEPSTVIDCSDGVPEVIREGLGPLDALL